MFYTAYHVQHHIPRSVAGAPVIVETKVVGRRTPFERRATELPEGTDTLEQLLTCLVQDEVQRYQERQDQVGPLRVLTERELTQGTAQGKITTAPQERSSAPNLQTATATVLQAFKDGLYYVFIDDQQIESLSASMTLKPDSTLLLLRLTALAGG